jgi:hypothetical protein
MWEPRCLTTIRAFTACYRESFTFFYLLPFWIFSCNNFSLEKQEDKLTFERTAKDEITVKRYVFLTAKGARGSVIGWGTMLQAGRSLWPWVDSASNINEYRESAGRGAGGDRSVGLTTLPPSVNQLSRENVGASTSDYTTGLHGLLQG